MYDKEEQGKKCGCNCSMPPLERADLKSGCKKKKRTFPKWLIWLLALLVLAAVFFAVRSIDKGEPAPQMPGQSENMPEGEETMTYAIGDTAKVGDVEITLVSVKEYNGSKQRQPGEGNKFVMFEFTIKNKSKQEIIISSKMNFAAYADGAELKQVHLNTKESDGMQQLDGSLAAGKKMSGVVSYEIPIGYKEAQVHYMPTTNASEHVVFSYKKEA